MPHRRPAPAAVITTATARAPLAPAATAIFLGCGLALALSAAAWAQDTPDSVQPGTEGFDLRIVAEGLEGPWELTLGPDGQLWVTERTGKRITRIDPATGAATTLATLPQVEAPGGQDGLLGLALDPALGQGAGRDHVYVAYTYIDETLPADPTVQDRASPYLHLYTKITRLTLAPDGATLTDPQDILTGLPASNDHNSGRLKFGPDGMLYLTVGDQGNNQLGNWCIPIEAQRLPTQAEIDDATYLAYVGKSLRIAPDGTIPVDNPELAGVKSHVFTYGHRNMQGLAFGPDGTLYASEQGPKTDDEINILRTGGNYGWPHVSGYADNNAYVYARWAESEETPCADLEFSDLEIPSGVPFDRETDWKGADAMTPPLATMFTVPSDWNFADPACKGIDFICWPTVAASSIEHYPATGGIPGWGNSLLVTTLKRGSLYRIGLEADGQATIPPFERYFQSENRFRDTALSPDGLTVYVATDPGGLAEALNGGTTTDMQNPGAILAFTWRAGGARPDDGQMVTGSTTAPDSPAPLEQSEEIATGQFLPATFTADQVNAGKASYNTACAACHGNTLRNGTMGPPLAGENFEAKWKTRTVADLYADSHDRMPPSRPASLPDETYAAITAYILRVNGTEPGEQPLLTDPDALANQYVIPPEKQDQ